MRGEIFSMKQFARAFLLTMLCVLIAMFAFACDSDTPPEGDDPNDPSTSTPGQPDDPDDPSLLSFSGITFDSLTVVYNGSQFEIKIGGSELPAGANVAYTNNKATNAGVYNATATVTCEGYNNLSLSATLTINKAKFTGLTFNGDTFTYDGDQHSVLYSGTVPEGTDVTYSNNTGTNAGTYNASVTFAKPNYETLTLNATLTINKATIAENAITFTDDTIEYDAKPHSIYIVGNLPAGANVTYTYNGQNVTSVTEVGTYNVMATITSPNHDTKELTATLKIKSTEEQLYSAVCNGAVYFQNNLDDNKLYKTTSSGIQKVNNDVPQHMIANGTTLYYNASALLGNTIKKYAGAVASVLYSENGEYLACDGTYIYYAINNTLIGTDKNGIYKYALSGDADREPVRLTGHKAAYIAYYNDNIYFSDKSNSNYLSRVSTSDTDQTPTVLYKEKAEYILVDNGVIYFNSVAGALGTDGSAIRKYTISSKTCIKLTTDAGKYLTKIDSYIYYVCDDWLTGTLFGKNIRKVSTSATEDKLLSGSTVVSDENNGYSSLASNGNCLYYYKLNDKHFYKYDTNAASNAETDLMKNFTPAAEELDLTGRASTAIYKGEIYYTNPADESQLYKYNPQTKQKTLVISDSVANMWFNGDTMYYSTFDSLTGSELEPANYASWSYDMKTGEKTKLSSERWENLIFDGNDIYYSHLGKTSTSLCKMGEENALCDKTAADVDNIAKVGNDFYFIDTPKLLVKPKLYKFTLNSTKRSDDAIVEAKLFEIYNNAIYYYDGDNSLKKCDLDGKNAESLVTDAEITDLYINNGILYYTNIKKNNVGLYSYNISSKVNSKITDKVAHGIIANGSDIYFINTALTFAVAYDMPSHEKTSTINKQFMGDGSLYCYNGSAVTKVA